MLDIHSANHLTEKFLKFEPECLVEWKHWIGPLVSKWKWLHPKPFGDVKGEHDFYLVHGRTWSEINLVCSSQSLGQRGISHSLAATQCKHTKRSLCACNNQMIFFFSQRAVLKWQKMVRHWVKWTEELFLASWPSCTTANGQHLWKVCSGHEKVTIVVKHCFWSLNDVLILFCLLFLTQL